MMVVPLLLGSLIITIFPNIWDIGGFTAALFSSAGISTLVGVQLFCMGTCFHLKDISKGVKRGGVLVLAKFLVGAGLGIAVGKLCGPSGFFGLSSLAIICAVTNSNGSIYLTLMGSYGDEADRASFSILPINDGPFLTLVALGASGLANIPFIALLAAIIPLILGVLIGNLDIGMRDIFAPIGTGIMPLVGFALGGSINLLNIVKGGFSGILLGLITVFVGGAFVLLCDKFISRRPGYAAWAIATTAGNAVAVPAAVAAADTALESVAATASVQVAASVVVTSILAPLMASWWAKKFGCPQMQAEIPLDEKQMDNAG